MSVKIRSSSSSRSRILVSVSLDQGTISTGFSNLNERMLKVRALASTSTLIFVLF
jgi:hypothetical protein